jgi:hypothetical protein
MARSGGVPEDDLYTFMMTTGAAERAVRYRQDAAKFRELAQAETNGSFREELMSIAKQYDQLAASLIPPDA